MIDLSQYCPEVLDLNRRISVPCALVMSTVFLEDG